MPEPTLSPYDPTLRDRLRWGLEDFLGGLGASRSTAQRYGDQLVGSPSSHGIAAADVVPYLGNALAADEGKRAYDRKDYLGAGLSAIAALPPIPMARVKVPVDDLVARYVDTDAVNRLWQKAPDYFVPPGAGGKLDRAKQFISDLGPADEFIPPTIGVNEFGVGFDDGRHRFAAMRDLGMEKAPVAMDPQSIANAERLGLLSSLGRADEDFVAPSLNVGYNPPSKLQRAFELDYPADYRFGEYTDDAGRLTRTIDGDPIRPGATVVGRRAIGSPEYGLRQPGEVASLAEGGLHARISDVAARDIGRDLGRFKKSYDSEGNRQLDILLRRDLGEAQRDRVLAHEAGHAIDYLAGGVPQEGLSRELNNMYSTLASGQERARNLTLPKHYGYRREDAPAELMAEAIRAYIADPNYVKTVAPNTAERIRKSWNTGPYADVLQFNSLAPLGLLGGGAALGLPAWQDSQQ